MSNLLTASGVEWQHPSLRPRNIVIFGESGVGKSSVINMIAGRIVARTSSDAVGCTFRHECHLVTLGDASVNLWDTAGLDEGSEGTVPAAQAEERLKAFLRQVTRSNGIDLLIYCIRGTRVRRALMRNYNIFYAAICRKKVPVALVVTGLENYEDDMEMWWVEHEEDLRKHDMQFDAHACVTTISSDYPAIQQRREHSQRVLRELVKRDFNSSAWITNENSLFSASLPDVRTLM
ncbi:P-loop containing nucleoside triphosphate hydrolase protein, partial [Phlebopus sp. FC_14]